MNEKPVIYGKVREYRDAYKTYCRNVYCLTQCPRVIAEEVTRPFNHEACHHCSLLRVYELGGGYDV